MFIQRNANPWDMNWEDCMIRAISLALHKPYMEVHDDMLQLAYDKDWKITELRTGWTYIVNNGYEACDVGDYKRTVKQYATDITEPRIVVVNGHMTYCEGGDWFDTWNPARYKVNYVFRKVKEN